MVDADWSHEGQLVERRPVYVPAAAHESETVAAVSEKSEAVAAVPDISVSEVVLKSCDPVDLGVANTTPIALPPPPCHGVSSAPVHDRYELMRLQESGGPGVYDISSVEQAREQYGKGCREAELPDFSKKRMVHFRWGSDSSTFAKLAYGADDGISVHAVIEQTQACSGAAVVPAMSSVHLTAPKNRKLRFHRCWAIQPPCGAVP